MRSAIGFKAAIILFLTATAVACVGGSAYTLQVVLLFTAGIFAGVASWAFSLPAASDAPQDEWSRSMK
jgi:hypothetical protein